MNKIVVAITGASGSIYAKVLLDKLMNCKGQFEELSVVMSDNAKTVWQTELGNVDFDKYEAKYFEKQNFNAPFASGSAKYNIMIIVPCSMGTLGRIATGVSDDLITRAADVMLKERRKLIIVPRETPYNLIHIRNMEQITLAGGIICPASPSYYSNPTSFEDLAATVVDRILGLANIEVDSFNWGK